METNENLQMVQVGIFLCCPSIPSYSRKAGPKYAGVEGNFIITDQLNFSRGKLVRAGSESEMENRSERE